MSWFRLGLLLLFAYLAYLLYVPVPDNINEGFKFRTVAALAKFCHQLGSVGELFVPGVLTRVKLTRGLFWTIRNYMLPSSERYAPDVKLERETFEGVQVHVYTPPGTVEADGKLLPGFIYIHGGGLGLFDPDHYDGLTRQISKKLGAVVISVDYRLTPEHKFPIPYEDSFRATRWFLQNALKYGVDPKRVAIGGDSAGGYLSAAVSQGIHDDAKTPNIKLQVLIYPWLQIVDLNTPSYQRYRKVFGSEGITSLEAMGLFSAMHIYGEEANLNIVHAFMTNNHTSKEFEESALFKERVAHSLVPAKYRETSYYTEPSNGHANTRVGEQIWSESKEIFTDPRLCPLFREDLSSQPITYIATVEYDSIRDDGIIYGKLLEQAGVDVTWRHYEDAFHGVVWVAPGVIFEDGIKILDEIIAFVMRRL